MKALVCELCGGNDFVKDGDFFVCQSCGTKYSSEDAKKMMIEGTVEVHGTVRIDDSSELENLYKLAREARNQNNSQMAANYYKQILLKKPNDWEANFYSVLFVAKQTTIAGIPNAAAQVGNCIGHVFDLISTEVEEASRNDCYSQVYLDVVRFNNLISQNGVNAAKQYSTAERKLSEMKKYGTCCAQLYISLGDALAKVGRTEDALKEYKAAQGYSSGIDANLRSIIIARIKSLDPNYTEPQSKGGCYVATCVYGSYDCPEVWTLRRYRDYTLAETWYGRAFIHTYYAISPTLVKWFGKTKWFKNIFKPKLDKMVAKLNASGVEDTPYNDRNW